MADYFEEMGWQPIDPTNIQTHQNILLARFFREHGFFGNDFDADQLPPPASKEVVSNLPEKTVTSKDEKCAICLKPNCDDSTEIFKILPCSHEFHNICILPWLERTNSCPLCRHELPTDNQIYEDMKKERQREVQRQEEMAILHDSMFG